MNETYIRLPCGKTKHIDQITIGDEILIVDPNNEISMSYTVTYIRHCKGYRINGIPVGDHVLTDKGIIPTSSILYGDKIYRMPYIPPTKPIPITVDPYCLGVCIYRNVDPDTSTLRYVPDTLRSVYMVDAFNFIGGSYIALSRYFKGYYPFMIEGKIPKDILYAPLSDLLCFKKGLFDVISRYDKTTDTYTIQTDDAKLLSMLEIICARTLCSCHVNQIDVEISSLESVYSYWIIRIQKDDMVITVKTINTPHVNNVHDTVDIGGGNMVCTANGVPIQYKLLK